MVESELNELGIWGQELRRDEDIPDRDRINSMCQDKEVCMVCFVQSNASSLLWLECEVWRE